MKPFTKLLNPVGLALMALTAAIAIFSSSVPLLAAAHPQLAALMHHPLAPSIGMSIFMIGNVLDVFNSNPFGVLALTDTINKSPFMPGRAGQVIQWNERGVATLSVMIEEIDGTLKLINPTPRGGPGTTRPKNKRTARTLTIPHYEVNDSVMADEVQGVRELGQEQQVKTVLSVVNQKLQDHVQLGHDPTLEYQRVGAVKGIILNADGSTLYNLFTEFGVSAPSDVQFTFSTSTSDGSIRKKCDAISRSIARALGGQTYTGVRAFAGDNWWDLMISSKETRETYLNQQEAAQLRDGTAFGTFRYGGVVFENYRGGVGSDGTAKGPENETGLPFLDPDEVRFFAEGVPGLFRTVYAPADWVETVNTLGLPRYAKQYVMDNGKGVNLDSQMNALSYCTRPRTLIKGTHA